ncbi:MAG: carbohydrate kinase family protein [Anaerolineales bacterium]|nr:carbohydrate kinase family protein [Anaerolineales bacterium]MCB8936812.1 carbohydrate kinase family protein [Ardenticatenaceae bacterium]
MSHTVIGLGNAVVDMSFRPVQFPIRPSEHQFMEQHLVTPGGMANTLICGTRLGLQMKSIGHIGDDALAEVWRRYLIAEGVDVSGQIVHDDQPTPLSICLTDAAGQHLFLGRHGKMQLQDGRFPQTWRNTIQSANGLILDGWNYAGLGSAGNLEAMAIAEAANIPIFFDPGPVIPSMPKAWLERMMQATVVLLTSDEAQLIVQESLPPEEMAERIRQLGAKLVILKLGANGMIGHTATETVYEPGIPVEVVDLIGAGDSVEAAVVFGYLEKYSLPKLLRLANATGAAAVQKFGAGINVPTLAEITAVLEDDANYR